MYNNDQSLRLCSVDNFSDPVSELRYPRVDSGSIPEDKTFSIFDSLRLHLLPVTTADAPADDPRQTPPSVLALHHQGASTVSLAAVLSSGLTSSTQENVRDPLVLARVPAGEIFNIIINSTNQHIRILELAMRRSTSLLFYSLSQGLSHFKDF